MISENAAKLCQEFCSENNEILASCSFSEKSIEHAAIRFIQRVAADVQIDGSDDIKNEGETKCALSEVVGVGSPAHTSHSFGQSVAADVQFDGSDYIKNDAKQISHLESEGFFNLPPTISYSVDFQRVAVGVQVAEGDELSPVNKVKSIKYNPRKSESLLTCSPAISQDFDGVQ